MGVPLCTEDAQAAISPRPISIKNKLADRFQAYSVCIMDYFIN